MKPEKKNAFLALACANRQDIKSGGAQPWMSTTFLHDGYMCATNGKRMHMWQCPASDAIKPEISSLRIRDLIDTGPLVDTRVNNVTALKCLVGLAKTQNDYKLTCQLRREKPHNTTWFDVSYNANDIAAEIKGLLCWDPTDALPEELSMCVNVSHLYDSLKYMPHQNYIKAGIRDANSPLVFSSGDATAIVMPLV